MCYLTSYKKKLQLWPQAKKTSPNDYLMFRTWLRVTISKAMLQLLLSHNCFIFSYDFLPDWHEKHVIIPMDLKGFCAFLTAGELNESVANKNKQNQKPWIK